MERCAYCGHVSSGSHVLIGEDYLCHRCVREEIVRLRTKCDKLQDKLNRVMYHAHNAVYAWRQFATENLQICDEWVDETEKVHAEPGDQHGLDTENRKTERDLEGPAPM